MRKKIHILRTRYVINAIIIQAKIAANIYLNNRIFKNLIV